MREVLENRENISALADGQLHGDEFARAAEWAAQDADGQITWQTYHVVGDLLRTGEWDAGSRDAAFMARFKVRLQQEPLPSRLSEIPELIAIKSINTTARAQKSFKNEAANDATFRWTRLAGLASVLAVTAVGFLASGLWNEQRSSPQLAQAATEAIQPNQAASALTGDGPNVMIRNSELDALLAAHRQFGGTTAFQVPTGFLRNATFEGGGR